MVGLIVVNGYLSDLQSYVTKPVLQPQIKTVADIYISPLTIMTQSQWKDYLLESKNYQEPHEDWDKKTLIVELQAFNAFTFNFNMSTAYVMNDLYLDMLMRIQQRLNMRGYYDTGVVVSRLLCTFPVSDALLFFDKINEVMHWLQSSGLFRRWLAEDFDKIEQQIRRIHRKRLERIKSNPELDFPTSVVYGWISSAIVLIIEIGWNKVGQLLSKRRR